MNPEYLLLRWQSRNVWKDPVRKIRTLESFAKTETDGGHDINAAADQVTEPDLLKHLRRHAREELNHGRLFSGRAATLRQKHGIASSDEAALDKPFDLTRGRESAELDAHGFFRASLFEEMGIISYVAMLHVAEQKAAALFRVHRDLTRDDPETCEIFEEILRDEKYHVAYTGSFLKKWRKEGKSKEVREALAEARGSRLWEAWKRAGARAGGNFGRVVLTLIYWTAMVPFAAVARMFKDEPGWQSPAGHHHHGHHHHGHHHHGHHHDRVAEQTAVGEGAVAEVPEDIRSQY